MFHVMVLAIASQCSAAELIVCTDGISNVGLGSLDRRDKESRSNVGVERGRRKREGSEEVRK